MVKLLKISQKKPPDLWLALLIFGLTVFGVIMVYNASVIEAHQLFSDKYYFFKQQALWAGIGLVIALITTNIHYQLYKRISPWLLGFNLILLLLVLIPGIGIQAQGARRWISFFGFNLQPTELIKLSLSIYLAAWLSKQRSFWLYLSVLGTILALVMLQPDLGTAVVIILSAILVYYISGAPVIHLLLVGILGSLSGLALIFSSTYRKERLLTFLNPARDPLGSSYHIRQALIAIGSGGLWGLGLGQSRQKYQFLPQVTTDSIFAIIAEETGFIGASLVIVVLFLIVFKAFKIARSAPDKFSQLLAAGIASWLGIQTLINISAMLALIPLTGVPLPFISYGGSSLIVNLTAVGILLNISRYQVKR